ncbi:hypothetical protein Tco_1417751 [Tanacetum coccineum]
MGVESLVETSRSEFTVFDVVLKDNPWSYLVYRVLSLAKQQKSVLIVGITIEEEDASELFFGIGMPKNGSLFMCDGASWSAVLEEGEPIDAVGS